MEKITFKNNKENIVEDYLLNKLSITELIRKYDLTKDQVVAIFRKIDQMTHQSRLFNDSYDLSEITLSLVIPKEIINNLKTDETIDLFKRLEEVKELQLSNPNNESLKREYESIRETLVIKYKALVDLCVKKFLPLVSNYEEDLEMYGYEGLIKAINNYNYKKHSNFITYSFQSIIHNIERYFKTLYGISWLDYVTKQLIEFYRKESLTYDEIKAKLKLTDRQMKNYAEMVKGIDLFSSLSEDIVLDYKPTIKNEMPITFEDYEAIDQYEDSSLIPVEKDYETKKEQEELREALIDALSTLTEREELVLKLHFGIDDKEKSHDDISNIIKTTGETVRNIENKALRKMRHPSREKNLRIFYDNTTYEPQRRKIYNDEVSRDEKKLKKLCDLFVFGITRDGMLKFMSMGNLKWSYDDLDKAILLLEEVLEIANASEFHPRTICKELRIKYYIILSNDFAYYICKNYLKLTEKINAYKEKYLNKPEQKELKREGNK